MSSTAITTTTITTITTTTTTASSNSLAAPSIQSLAFHSNAQTSSGLCITSALEQSECEAVGYKSFKIVIDNVDMTVKSRYMRVDDYRNKSLHYVNSYAVQSRVDFSHLPDVYPHTCSNTDKKNALLLLPSVHG